MCAKEPTQKEWVKKGKERPKTKPQKGSHDTPCCVQGTTTAHSWNRGEPPLGTCLCFVWPLLILDLKAWVWALGKEFLGVVFYL